MPKELATSFKAINRLDLHALDDVTDKQLQDLAAAQHVPHEDNLLAQALRKLHGGSICSRSECPSVTGTLSRAESFDMDDNMSEATSSTSVAKQLTPLRRRLSLPHRAAASHHSSKPSMESLGSPFAGSAKASSGRLWLPPKFTDLPTLHTDNLTPNDGPPPLLLPNLATEQPSSSQTPPTPPINPSDSPLLQSFHSAASFSTQSVPSQRGNSHRGRPPSGRRTKRMPHPRSQAQMRLAEESIGAPTPGMISAHRPSSVQGAEPEPALAWLTSISISQCWRVTDAGVSALAGLTTLEELDMSCCIHVNRAGFAAIATLPHLSSLTVARMMLSAGSLECLGTMTGDPAHAAHCVSTLVVSFSSSHIACGIRCTRGYTQQALYLLVFVSVCSVCFGLVCLTRATPP